MAASFTRRALGVVARRLDRPQLVSAFYPGALRDERDELAMSAVLAAALSQEDCYVDVGSNRGQVLAEAVRLAPAGRHFAFEPIPALAAGLRERFAGVEVREKALGASPGAATFCHFTRLDGWSGLRRNPQISDEQGAPEYIDVEVSTLDAELAGQSPRVIKIDVEGAELGVLEGGRGLLERARPLLVFEHVQATGGLYDGSPGAIFDLLEAAGYRVTSLTGEGPYDRAGFLAAAGSVVNWLAAPRR